MNNKTSSIQTLLKYIEENIRVSDDTDIDYIDSKGHLARLNSKQNQVVFGRRGSGKTLLVKSLKKESGSFIYIKIDIETYKDISFPNSILQVLIKILTVLNTELSRIPLYNVKKRYKAFLISKKIEKRILDYKKSLKEPDLYEKSFVAKNSNKKTSGIDGESSGIKGSFSKENSLENEESKTHLIDKLNNIKIEIPEVRDIIEQIISLFDKHIFLVFDDFYFIRKGEQPFFIDFFHRIAKGIMLYIKIATIKHRTGLYFATGNTFIGTEINQDIQTIDLDYSFDQFDRLKTFMKELLQHIIFKSKADIKVDELLNENAFNQLCLASGGVPRDFLALFLKLGDKMLSGKKVSKTEVAEISIENLPNKLDALKTDSGEDKAKLEHCLNFFKILIVTTRKTNVFLVPNEDILNYPEINQSIKELMDMRLLHLVDSNTSSAPSDGKRYSAYMIDTSLYNNSKPRDFKQIEPGKTDLKGRKDNMRASPRLNLLELSQFVDTLSNVEDTEFEEVE